MFKSMFTKNYEDLGGQVFKKMYKETPGAVLLDVRTPGEFSSGHISGAKNIDFTSSSFGSKIAALDKSKTYFLYCRSGARSGGACNAMAAEGFKVYNLAGGIGSWPR